MTEHIAVRIYWNDASLLSGYHKSDAKNIGLSKMETTGILVAEKLNHIEVALTATETEDEFGEILSIPKSQIGVMEILQYKDYFKFKND